MDIRSSPIKRRFLDIKLEIITIRGWLDGTQRHSPQGGRRGDSDLVGKYPHFLWLRLPLVAEIAVSSKSAPE
jgi:hypothetical protein